MVLNEYYTLSNGVKIPKLGLGTWFIEDSKVPETVKQAVQIGYRHIDTARRHTATRPELAVESMSAAFPEVSCL